MRISNLPKWAQEYIEELQRERNHALAELAKNDESRVPEPGKPYFYETDMLFFRDSRTGERTRYFEGHSIQADHSGVSVGIILPEDSNEGIRISFSVAKPRTAGQRVAVLPVASNVISLMLVEQARSE